MIQLLDNGHFGPDIVRWNMFVQSLIEDNLKLTICHQAHICLDGNILPNENNKSL